jgi:hypothetical protein
MLEICVASHGPDHRQGSLINFLLLVWDEVPDVDEVDVLASQNLNCSIVEYFLDPVGTFVVGG